MSRNVRSARLMIAAGVAMVSSVLVSARAEPAYQPKIGDDVEAYTECPVMLRWCHGTLTSITDGFYVIQYGTSRYDTARLKVGEPAKIRTWTTGEAIRQAEAAREADARQFLQEIGPYFSTISDVIGIYDPVMHGNSGSGYHDDPAHAAGYLADLAAVAARCKAHPNLGDLARIYDPKNIFEHPLQICALAAARDQVPKRAKLVIVNNSVQVRNDWLVADLQKHIDGTDHEIPDSVQQLVFDQPTWLRGRHAEYGPRYAEAGVAVPADAFAPILAKVPALKARIDADGTTEAYARPGFHDAAIEKLVRAKLAAQLPGVQILAIGAVDKNWAAYDEKTWVKRDANYDYYLVHKGKNKYRRGWALVRLPDRPYCQAREWIVRRIGRGRTELDYLGEAGKFVTCTP